MIWSFIVQESPESRVCQAPREIRDTWDFSDFPGIKVLQVSDVTRTDFYINFLVCLVCIVIQKYDWWKEIRKVCEFQLKALGHTHPCHAYWMGFTHCIYIHVFPKGTWTCSEILWHFTVQQCHKIIFFPEFNNFLLI